MQDQTVQKTAIEAGKVLDSLAALSVRLSCHCDVPADKLVLEAGKVKEACEAIDDAVAALKRILAITDAKGTSVFVDTAGKTPGSS